MCFLTALLQSLVDFGAGPLSSEDKLVVLRSGTGKDAFHAYLGALSERAEMQLGLQRSARIYTPLALIKKIVPCGQGLETFS